MYKKQKITYSIFATKNHRNTRKDLIIGSEFGYAAIPIPFTQLKIRFLKNELIRCTIKSTDKNTSPGLKQTPKAK